MITQEFLNEVAEFTDSKISKVVINESYDITDFIVKQATNNEVLLRYMVPFGSVTEVQHIELRDELDDIISSNPAYVPIASDTIITQTVSVREAS